MPRKPKPSATVRIRNDRNYTQSLYVDGALLAADPGFEIDVPPDVAARATNYGWTAVEATFTAVVERASDDEGAD